MSVDLEPTRTLYLVSRQQKCLFFLPRVNYSIRWGVCLEAAGKCSTMGYTCPGPSSGSRGGHKDDYGAGAPLL